MTETEETGPVQTGVWDTRTRENSRWCPHCKHWLALRTFSWIRSLDERLVYHQELYCKNSPTYKGVD